jgi:flagellar hook protein FlgE
MDGTGRPATSDPAATVAGYSIDKAGNMVVRLSDNTEFVRGQILLQNFQNPQALLKMGDNLYTGFVGAGPLGGATPQSEAPNTNGLGTIQSGALELSNVDLAGEFAGLITTQRGFQANARVITTSDELLQELVNLKR